MKCSCLFFFQGRAATSLGCAGLNWCVDAHQFLIEPEPRFIWYRSKMFLHKHSGGLNVAQPCCLVLALNRGAGNFILKCFVFFFKLTYRIMFLLGGKNGHPKQSFVHSKFQLLNQPTPALFILVLMRRGIDFLSSTILFTCRRAPPRVRWLQASTLLSAPLHHLYCQNKWVNKSDV